MISASKEDRDITECYKLGVDSYMPKSLELDVFEKGISDLVTFWMDK